MLRTIHRNSSCRDGSLRLIRSASFMAMDCTPGGDWRLTICSSKKFKKAMFSSSVSGRWCSVVNSRRRSPLGVSGCMARCMRLLRSLMRRSGRLSATFSITHAARHCVESWFSLMYWSSDASTEASPIASVARVRVCDLLGRDVNIFY